MLLVKYLNGYGLNDPRYVPPGWDEWYGKVDDYYDYQLNENDTLVSYGSDDEDYYTDVLAAQEGDYVRRAAEDSRPFFMYLASAAPHGPFTPVP